MERWGEGTDTGVAWIEGLDSRLVALRVPSGCYTPAGSTRRRPARPSLPRKPFAEDHWIVTGPGQRSVQVGWEQWVFYTIV
jgi:hypothetical protein